MLTHVQESRLCMNWRQLKEDIVSLVQHRGSSFRTDCVSCGGRGTLSITDEPYNILYNCHRASCNLRGKIKKELSLEEIKQRVSNNVLSTAVPTSIHNFTDVKDFSYTLPQDAVDWLDKRGVRGFDLNLFRWDERQCRIVVPLYSKGQIVNYAGRTIWDFFKPKMKIYGHGIEVPPFVMACKSDMLVIVEDFCSAIVVRRKFGMNGFALMGTNFKLEYHSRFILEDIKPKKVYVALDRDALKKSLKLVKQLKAAHTDVTLLSLSKDLKDMSDNELVKVLGVM